MKTTPLMIAGLILATSLGAFAQPAGALSPTASAAPSPSLVEPPRPTAPLSKAASDKIAKMTPLFDGKTLDGWIQMPAAPLKFGSSDFTDVAAFVKKLADKTDPLSAFLSEQLDEAGKTAIAGFSPTADPKTLKSALTKNLNRIVTETALYDAARFKSVRLRPETEALRQKNPQGLELRRLNRVLLEDAFPAEIAQSPSIAWVVKDGAMSSMGAGRGTIYTKDDYSHYRLIFALRQIQADHAPCVLIYCTRPPAGEEGLDALAGIQFQPPNGGSWDYRPGKNNAGKGLFAKVPHARIDPKEWALVELIVKPDGTARMAVAQPIGTKAVEVLTFNDPTAAKTGPIAWQMHNAGIFDQFKNVKIEVDPKDDRFITTE